MKKEGEKKENSKKGTEIVEVQKQEVVEQPRNADALISLAIERGSSVETLNQLFDLRQKMKAEQAKEAFVEAMAAFQAECPVIVKDKKVYEKNSTKVRYKYAPLDSIIRQLKGIIGKHGFSYTIDTPDDEKFLIVQVTVTHKLGHSEVSTFRVPIGTEQYMSDVQKYGARLTFAKRYAFCNAFGILTGDDDTDATKETVDYEKKPQSNSAPAAAPAKNASRLATKEQREKLIGLLDILGRSKEWFEEKTGKPLEQLSEKKVQEAIESAQAKINEQEKAQKESSDADDEVPLEEIDIDKL